ncbi:protein prenyltransferase alpha subunit repeat-containing protein 1 isoform 2-T2 [Polymixia lowei]
MPLRETQISLVDITSTLLLLNPDFTTAWNVRKELQQCGVLNPEKDLYLGKLALTKFPKSPETWIHRRWVLLQVLQECSGQGGYRKEQGEAHQSVAVAVAERSQSLCEHLTRTLHQEMKVCSDAACRYPSNYNAWSHRIWVLQHMAMGNVKVLHDELSSMRLWVSMHVSDHSGFHYRQFLIKELMSELCHDSESAATILPQQQPIVSSKKIHHQTHLQANREASGAEGVGEEELQPGLVPVLQLFHQELELCTDLIQSFPGHETLWCHRRHVFYLWHHWRREHQHYHCTSNRGTESPHLNHIDPGLSSNSCTSLSQGNGRGCGRGDTMNGQPHASEAMEVDGGMTLPDPHDTKRLKRGLLMPCPPNLASEHRFIISVLDGSCNLEQKRFALAYKKWLNTVIGQ